MLPPHFPTQREKVGQVCQIVRLRPRQSGPQCPKPQSILVANTHLFYHPMADHVRVLQAYAICHKLEEIRREGQHPDPLLICGDFNSIPFHPVLSKIKKHLKIINQQYENYSYTFPTNYPILQLDKCYSNEYITNNITLLDSTPDATCKFSDHLPLINQFLIK